MNWTARSLAAVLTLASVAALGQGQVREAKMNPIGFTAKRPAIDGELTEWSSASRIRVSPIPVSEGELLQAGKSKSTFDFPADATSTSIALMYDQQNLYLGLDWNDPTPAVNTAPEDRPQEWNRHGDGFELVLAGAVNVHLAAWPVDGGRKLAVWVQRDGKAWERAAGAEGRIVIRPDRSGWALELAVPWQALTGRAEPPTGELHAAWDLAWSGLDYQVMGQLGVQDLRANCHVSTPALTARPEFKLNAHLPQPSQWGELKFGAGAEALKQVDTPVITDATAVGCPEARGIRIDGRIDDWKDGAFFDFALMGGLLSRRYAGRIATAYDADNFYAVAVLRHPTGQPYNFAPAATGAGYGGGDALQIRFSDRKNLNVSVCAWLDSTTGRPAFTVDGNEHGFKSLLEKGAELAFAPLPEEGAYVTELKIPWRALLIKGAQPPKKGDTWQVTFQPWWRFGSPAFSWLADFSLEPVPPLQVRYEMPRDGYLALGVFSPDGKLLRQLVKSEFRARGAQSEPWDGRDQFGNFVAAGEYRVKGIVTDRIQGVYEFTAGNPGTPAWPTPDGRGDWLSDEAPPQAVVTDGENVYVAAPGSEKGFAVMALDRDGKRLWGLDEPFYPRCVSLSLHDGKLYALYSGPVLTDNTMRYNGKNAVERGVLICYDARTGERLDFSARNPHTEIGRWPYREEVTPLWEMIQQRSFRPEKYLGQPRYFDSDMGESTGASGVAATSGAIVVSKIYENKLELFDPATARKTGELPLERPVGLYALNDREILAVSAGKVVKVELASGKVTPVVTSNLSAPVAVTVDRQGKIYVSDWADSFQVKVFDQDGKFLRAIGREGGRPWLGKWDPDGMLLPHGIAVTDNGELWVAEADTVPKRLSVWDAASGKFKRDYIGPTPYGGGTFFWIDPAEPEVMHTMGCRFRIDWATGKTEILGSELRRMSADQPFVPNGNSCMGSGVRVFQHDGVEYIAAASGRSVVILRKQGEIYQPVAAVGGLHRWTTDDGTGETTWDSDIGRHLYKNRRPEPFRGHAGDNYAWSDLNGDGLVQAEELTWAPTLTRGESFVPGGKQTEYITGWGGSAGADGTVYFSGFCKDKDVIYQVRPERWTAHGPVFDIRQAREFASFDTNGAAVVSGLFADSTGQVNVAADVPGRRSYPESGKLSYAAVGLGPDGQERWRIAAPQDMGETAFAASNFCGEWQIPGIGPVLGTWNWWWNFRPYFISQDGLYLGTALEETKLGPLALWSESANFYFQRPDGTPYLVNGANQAHHFVRIDGFKNAQRFEGVTTVTADDLVRAKKASEIVKVRPLPRPEIVITQLATAPVPDGKLDDWRDASFVELDGGKGRAARMALARCGDKLYLAAEVDDPSPMRQVGTDYQTLFTTGDVVDLMLATDPAAPADRRSAAVGDLRLAFSEMKGQPVAVLYQPVLKEKSGEPPRQLMAARFDRIVKLDTVKTAIVRRDRGYTLEAEIPLAELGLTPDGTAALRGDLGVVFSDTTGGRELRLYYYNKRTDMVADLTTEATLQPAEWGPVIQPLGVNLLKNGSFERDFVKDAREGWLFEVAQNGATATFDGQVAFAGRRSLLLESPLVEFSEEAKLTPQWEDFVKAANGGKGGGHISLCQEIPVQGGKAYRSRLRFRSTDLRVESRAPGQKRGYSAAIIYVFYKAADGKSVGTQVLARLDGDHWEWQTVNDLASRSEAQVGGTLTAPEGATSAIVSIKFTSCAPDIRPQLWIDDFEVVEKK